MSVGEAILQLVIVFLTIVVGIIVFGMTFDLFGPPTTVAEISLVQDIVTSIDLLWKVAAGSVTIVIGYLVVIRRS